MAYEVPFNIGRQNRDLGGELLRPILPETTLASGICLNDILGWVEFGNCHQFDSWRQFLKYSFEIIFYHSSWLAPAASGPASSELPQDAAATCS